MVERNLLYKLAARAESGNPLRIGLIGAGKFGTTFLSQARYLSGLHVLGIADLSIDRLHRALNNTAWQETQYAATSFENALKSGGTYLTEDAESLIKADGIELLVEATGNPSHFVLVQPSIFTLGKFFSTQKRKQLYNLQT